MPKTIHFVSLGCPKNRVDSEVMLGVAERSGYRHVEDASDASVIVVNTCGFIDAAKEESINTILELAKQKSEGRCEKLVVTGCLSQRHPDELARELPEIDHLLGSSDMLKLESVLGGKAERMLVGNPADWLIDAADPRRISTRGRSAYVKLGEGCNRTCSFCVIPELRGKQRSRGADDIVREVEQLADAGVLEVNLVSQDTVAWGRDRDHAPTLAALVERIANVRGIRWVRLFYLYPEKLGDDLITLLGEHPRVVPYVDMPLQHAADAMLRRMRRGHGGRRLYELVERLKKRIANLTFRTAFIVGHPGETEAEFQELVDFVKFAEFDRMGVFRFSDEPSARSHLLEAKVARRTIEARARKLMSIQRPISRRKNRALVGRELEVLVEGPSEDSELVMAGRHAGQAPEIDGTVYLSGGPVLPGELRRALVTQATDYDLVAEALDPIELENPRAPGRRKSKTAGRAGAGVSGLVHHASDGRRVLRTVS